MMPAVLSIAALLAALGLTVVWLQQKDTTAVTPVEITEKVSTPPEPPPPPPQWPEWSFPEWPPPGGGSLTGPPLSGTHRGRLRHGHSRRLPT